MKLRNSWPQNTLGWGAWGYNWVGRMLTPHSGNPAVDLHHYRSHRWWPKSAVPTGWNVEAGFGRLQASLTCASPCLLRSTGTVLTFTYLLLSTAPDTPHLCEWATGRMHKAASLKRTGQNLRPVKERQRHGSFEDNPEVSFSHPKRRASFHDIFSPWMLDFFFFFASKSFKQPKQWWQSLPKACVCLSEN